MTPFSCFKPGDWGMLLAGAALTAWLALTLWGGGSASKVIIRSGGHLFAEADLARDQRIAVPGPLGTSWISIEQRRVRVASDPSPRQLCVKQGWLSQAGDAAICLPNQVSVELTGLNPRFDSLNY